MKRETIRIAGRDFRRFIHMPEAVEDGTCRCIACGQIDDEPWHDSDICQQARANSIDLLTPGQIDEVACRLTDAQRSVVLALGEKPSALGCSEPTAKRLTENVTTRPALVSKRYGNDSVQYVLTPRGIQVRDYFVRRAAA